MWTTVLLGGPEHTEAFVEEWTVVIIGIPPEPEKIGDMEEEMKGLPDSKK